MSLPFPNFNSSAKSAQGKKQYLDPYPVLSVGGSSFDRITSMLKQRRRASGLQSWESTSSSHERGFGNACSRNRGNILTSFMTETIVLFLIIILQCCEVQH